MISRFTTVLKREVKIIPTNTLLMQYNGISGGKGSSRTVTGSTAALEVRSRPLLQSTTVGRKLRSSQRGTVSHGTRAVAPKKTARTNTRLLRRKLENQVEVVLRVGRVKTIKSKITCKYWKAGRCKRGSECEFSHAGKQKPRKATPARSGSRSSRGSDKKDKRRKDKRGKRDKSGRRSGSEGS